MGWRRAQQLVGVVVCVAVVANTACSGDDGQTAPVATQTSAVTTADAIGEVTLTSSDGTPIEGMTAGVVNATVGVPTGFNSAAPLVDINVRVGTLTEPVVLSIAGSPPPAGAIPLILHGYIKIENSLKS